MRSEMESTKSPDVRRIGTAESDMNTEPTPVIYASTYMKPYEYLSKEE